MALVKVGTTVLSGLMLEHFWWGSTFLGMAVLAALALLVGHILLPTSRHAEDARLDPAGVVLAVVGVTGLLSQAA